MEWITLIGESWLGTLTWIVKLGVPLGLFTCLMPCNRRMFWFSDARAAITDCVYWFMMPLAGRVIRTFGIAVGIALLFGDQPGFGAVRELPLGLQCIVLFVFQDVLLYWIHRAFHTRSGWSFHAIHHSPKTLDWMSAGRSHLVNTVFSVMLADAVALCLGFTTEALMVILPLGTMYSAMVHANLNWTFGPLRYVLASPVFHRWHHVAEGDGINKNFASTFPILDLIFGTFYMPSGQLPANFGNGEEAFPEGFWGQFFYPFRRKPRIVEQPVVSQPVRGRLVQGGIVHASRKRKRVVLRDALPTETMSQPQHI